MLIKELVDNLVSGLAAKNTFASADKNDIRAIVESVISKSPWVTRDEFATQQAVLQRTREKLQQLEKQLVELQHQCDRRPGSE